MKTGKTLNELAAEITRQQAAARDLIADTRELKMSGDGALLVGSTDAYTVNGHAHNQIGDRVGIPSKYYDRMLKSAPDLLATNVNRWFKDNPERRMIRTLDGGLRMLTPPELYGCQGFPKSYVIDRGHDGRHFSKATQVRMCGNSVSPPPAIALLRANFQGERMRVAA